MADNFDKFYPDWVVGTLTLISGSRNFTATNAQLTLAAIREGDTIITPGGLTIPIESINANGNGGVLAQNAPAAAAGTYATRIRFQSDNSRFTGMLAALVSRISGGNLQSIAGLEGAADKGIMFTGAGTAGTFDLTAPARELLNDTTYAAMLDTLGAARRSGETFGGTVTAPVLQIRNPSGTVVGVINSAASGDAGINYFAGVGGHQWGGAGLGGMTWVNNTLTVPGIGSFSSSGNNVKLTVSGYGASRGFGAYFRAGVAGAASVIQFQNASGTAVGSIGTTDTATAFNTSSDWRLKPSVEPLVTFELSADDFDELDDALLRVMSMRPVRHNWHNDLLTFVHGFIAHELQAPAPHAVTGKKDAVEEIGTAVVAGEIIPAHTRSETRVIDGKAVDVLTEEPERQLPDRIYENVRAGEYENEKSWTKTGERPVYQGVDHSKIVPDLTAALQSLTLMVLKQRDQIAALESRLNET